MAGIAKLLCSTVVSLCLSFFITGDVCGQQTTSSCIQIQDSILHKPIYTNVDKLPEPVGGMGTLNKAIYKQLKYPPGDAYYTGKAIVAFVVQANGKIAGKRVIRDPSSESHLFSDQVVKIVSSLKWKPALCNNKPVASLYILPVNITISDQ